MPFSQTYIKIQWGILLFVLFIDIIWIATGLFNIYYNLHDLFILLLLLFSLYLPYSLYKKYRPEPKIMSTLITAFFFLSFIPLVIILSYLACSLNFPLFDETFTRWDNYFGFNPKAHNLWFHEHRLLNNTFVPIYNTFIYQLPILLFYFGFFVKTNDLQRFILLYMIAALLTVFLSALFPTPTTFLGATYPLQAGQVDTLKSFFDARNHIFDFNHSMGIISFPSFHTVVALIYAYMFRNHRKIIFIPILILNCLMIFACLAQGGHFLVDLIAGAAVFVIAAAIEQRIFLTVSKYELHRGKKQKELKESLITAK